MFNSQDTVLLLIDHQVGTMQLIKNIPLELVKRNTIALAKAAKILDIPVILTSSQEENLQGALIPELSEFLPNEYNARIKRKGVVNAWDDPVFLEAVKKANCNNIIMAGVTTDVCLIFPAISAVKEGYKVQAVLDASGSPFAISEEMAKREWKMQVLS